jgi:hypothetical protein
MSSEGVAQKLWNYCNDPGLGRSLARSPARGCVGVRVNSWLTLRDDGMSPGYYVESPSNTLFLKRDDERGRPSYTQPSPMPAASGWPALWAKVDHSETLSQRWRL